MVFVLHWPGIHTNRILAAKQCCLECDTPTTAAHGQVLNGVEPQRGSWICGDVGTSQVLLGGLDGGACGVSSVAVAND